MKKLHNQISFSTSYMITKKCNTHIGNVDEFFKSILFTTLFHVTTHQVNKGFFLYTH